MWNNPTTCQVTNFLNQHALTVIDTGSATVSPKELAASWEEFERQQKADNYPWPFELTPELRTIYAKYLWPYKFAICVSIAVALVLVQVLVLIVPAYRRRRLYLEEIFHGLLAGIGGNHEETRVTFFSAHS